MIPQVVVTSVPLVVKNVVIPQIVKSAHRSKELQSGLVGFHRTLARAKCSKHSKNTAGGLTNSFHVGIWLDTSHPIGWYVPTLFLVHLISFWGIGYGVTSFFDFTQPSVCGLTTVLLTSGLVPARKLLKVSMVFGWFLKPYLGGRRILKRWHRVESGIVVPARWRMAWSFRGTYTTG